MLFVNYLSTNCDKDRLKEYNRRRGLFYTSARYQMPDSKVMLLNGTAGDDRFVEGLKMLKNMKEKYSVPIAYLDCDTVIVEPIDDLFDIDFDVGVVYRHAWRGNNQKPQDCLGGFLFFSQRRPELENQFLDNLIDETQRCYNEEIADGTTPWYYDQTAINNLVGKPPRERTDHEYKFAKYYEPCLKDLNGLKILYLSANVWACPISYYLPPKIKIFHYNHYLWFRYVKPLKEPPIPCKVDSAEEVLEASPQTEGCCG